VSNGIGTVEVLYGHAQYSDMAVLDGISSWLYAIFAKLTYLYKTLAVLCRKLGAITFYKK